VVGKLCLIHHKKWDKTKGQERERHGRTIQDLIIKREEEDSRGRKTEKNEVHTTVGKHILNPKTDVTLNRRN
jgi:hypothetical protein